MIYVDLRNSDFYDDAQVLIKSFYPRMQTSLLKDDSRLTDEDTVIYADTSMCEGVSKKEAHDRFKKNLYLKLQGDTGKNLPWGYLTGVRPSKIAYSMLEAGNSDEEIMSEFEEKHFVSHDKAELAMQVAKTEKKILEDIDYTNGYSIYIGIPFCPTTCLYCSFTSYSLAANRSKVDLYLDALVKDTGKADDAERDDIVQQDDGKYLPEVLAVHNVLHAEEHLQHAVDKSGADAPLRAVAVADQDERKHAAHGDAAAEGPGAGELKQAENGTDGDEHGALHKAAQAQTARGNGHRGFLQNKNSALQTVLGKQCGRPLSLRRHDPCQVCGSGRDFAQSQPEASDPPKKDLFCGKFSIPEKEPFVKHGKTCYNRLRITDFSGMEANHV